jgi:hypothetical protein
MQTSYFTPSINIIRDQNNDVNYIPTINGQEAFNKIINGYLQGTRSFSIVGSYGTGKSSFLLAFQKVVTGAANYFPNSNARFTLKDASFISLVGKYKSFEAELTKELKNRYSKNIDLFELLEKFSKEVKKENKLGVITIDEFGKFLEYAVNNDAEKEMYFIQQLAEFVNDSSKNLLFITSLHQSFSSYAYGMDKQKRNEWDKVKGRLIEIGFNEPVEQLLYLASERLAKEDFNNQNKTTNQTKLFKAIDESSAFPLKDHFHFDVAKKLYPFDILSAAITTSALQEYGQNERSLFTFIENNDFKGLRDYDKSNPFYNLACVYDYLTYSLYTYLNSKYNPHFSQWNSLKVAIDRVETSFDSNISDYLKIIKTIGLLNLFIKQGAKLDDKFLNIYCELSLGIKNPSSLIDNLRKEKIIIYRSFSKRYVLFEGTDVDIEQELINAESRLGAESNIFNYLHEYFDFPIITAKSIFFKKGTPRYFEYILSEKAILDIPNSSKTDGIINIVFDTNLKEKELITKSKDCQETILYGYFKGTEELRDIIREIEKIKIVQKEYTNDKVVQRELDDLFQHQVQELNQLFKGFLIDNSKNSWYYKGNLKKFQSERQFNRFLSEVCEEMYPSTPVLKNELMNRERVSGVISRARRELISRLIEKSHIENLDFPKDKFPADKTIYLSLIKNTGIHQEIKGKWCLDKPSDETYKELWNTCEQFLLDCNVSRRNLGELIGRLQKRPFKLKQGFIDFWIPLFLIAKETDFAFYEGDAFVPSLTDDTLDVALKQPQKYYIKSFYLDEDRLKIFNNYRFILDQIEVDKASTNSFIETIKPFLTFYRGLVPFSKQTKAISKEAINLRNSIKEAIDPEKSFFEDYPRAMGYALSDFFKSDDKLESFAIKLRGCIQELSSAYENLINRFEEFLNRDILGQELSFPDNKELLKKRYKKLKLESLKPNQKVFYQRINTALDDRKSWLNSVAMAIIGKSLDNFTDNDEALLKTKLKKLIGELDNLTDLSKKDIDTEREEVLKLEITSFVKGVQKNLIRIPKSKNTEIAKLEKEVKAKLSAGDKQLNIALLVKLLQEQIDNE